MPLVARRNARCAPGQIGVDCGDGRHDRRRRPGETQPRLGSRSAEATPMSIESDRPPKAAERVAMLAALLDGDVPLAYRLALELLGYGVPFDDIVIDVLAPVQAE